MAARGTRPAVRADAAFRRVVGFSRERFIHPGDYLSLCPGAGAFRVGRGGEYRIDYRFAAGDPALFTTYAAALVGQAPDVILATTSPAISALRRQTGTIPIV